MLEKFSLLSLNFFKFKWTLLFIKYYNLIVLTLFTLICFIYLLDYTLYKKVCDILIGILGFNIAGLIYIGYVTFRLKFCNWQILAYFFNVIINILWIFLKILSLFIVFKYDLILLTILSSIFLTYTIKYMINGRENNNIFNKYRK